MRDEEPFETDQPAELSHELNQFADRLKGFQPTSSRLDREQFMFEAGRAAAYAEINRTIPSQDGTGIKRSVPMRVLRLWQTAALLMAAVSLSLATSVVLRGHPEAKVIVVERNVPLPNPTRVAGEAPQVHDQLIPAENGVTETATAVKIGVNPNREKSIVANSSSVDVWSSSIAQRPSSQVQKALEFALANGLSQPDRAGRSNVPAGPNRSVVPNEPALSPLSLRGDGSGPLIQRLVEEHAL